MKKRNVTSILDLEPILPRLTFSKAGKPLDGEPTEGFFGVRCAGELPADREEISRALRARFPKCLFSWKSSPVNLNPEP